MATKGLQSVKVGDLGVQKFEAPKFEAPEAQTKFDQPQPKSQGFEPIPIKLEVSNPTPVKKTTTTTSGWSLFGRKKKAAAAAEDSAADATKKSSSWGKYKSLGAMGLLLGFFVVSSNGGTGSGGGGGNGKGGNGVWSNLFGSGNGCTQIPMNPMACAGDTVYTIAKEILKKMGMDISDQFTGWCACCSFLICFACCFCVCVAFCIPMLFEWLNSS